MRHLVIDGTGEAGYPGQGFGGSGRRAMDGKTIDVSLTADEGTGAMMLDYSISGAPYPTYAFNLTDAEATVELKVRDLRKSLLQL